MFIIKVINQTGDDYYVKDIIFNGQNYGGWLAATESKHAIRFKTQVKADYIGSMIFKNTPLKYEVEEI